MTDPAYPSLPAPLPPKFCFACGRPVDPRAEICPQCGVRQAPPPAAAPIAPMTAGKSRVIAALLALLFGGVGFHKMYLGKVAQGVLYLLFCWTYIPSIIAWVEAIRYLSTSDEAWNAQHGGPPHESSRAAIGCLWIIALGPIAMFALVIFALFLGGQVHRV